MEKTNLNTIASFQVDHDKLERGMYISRIDGDVFTYDLRFVKPNTPPYMDVSAMHTLEHLYATLLRNSEFADNIIYFGPMGCRTGFYLLTRGLGNSRVIEAVADATAKIAAWSGDIPGATRKECGNYLDHDLEGAKALAAGYLEVMSRWTQDMLSY